MQIKNFERRDRWIGILGLLAFLVPIVSALSGDTQAFSSALSGTSNSNSLGSASLSCQSVHKMLVWARSHHGLGNQVILDSARFRSGVEKALIKILDPHGLVSTEADAVLLTKISAKGWADFLSDQDCSRYLKWIEDYRRIQLHRLNESLLSLKLDVLVKRAVGKGIDQFEVFPDRNLPLAPDDRVVRERVKEAALFIARQTSPRAIELYASNFQQMLRDGMESYIPLLSGDGHSIEVFAKAVLMALDPYSTYFSNQEFEDFSGELSGTVSGLGIGVRWTPRGFLVEKVLPNSPASRSKKLCVGDVIIGIDGRSVLGSRSGTARKWLTGREGTQAVLLTNQKGEASPKTVKVVREPFDLEDAKVETKVYRDGLKKSVVVFEVPSFYGPNSYQENQPERSSSQELEASLKRVLRNEKRRLGAVVLDLRGNPGGFLEEAVQMAELFIGDKPVVGVVDPGSSRVIKGRRIHPIYSGPMVVLVDRLSASAAEVLAGALKDHQRALILGSDHTYGKGSVQKIFHFSEASLPSLFSLGPSLTGVVKLTTSLFYSPLGHSPSNGGVHSHLDLSKTREKQKATSNNNPILQTDVRDREPFLEAKQVEQIGKAAQMLEKKVSMLREKIQSSEGVSDPDIDLEAITKSTPSDPDKHESILGKAIAIADEYSHL